MIPEIRSRSTGPSTCTPIVSPTSKSSLPAVSLSTTTSFGPGQPPSTSVSGLNGELGFGNREAEVRRAAVDDGVAVLVDELRGLGVNAPFRLGDAGQRRTSSRSDSGKDGSLTPLCSLMSNGDLPVMTASDPTRISVKILSNAWSIESVRT